MATMALNKKLISIPNEVIFTILRIIKKHNKGDQYLEAYLGHLAKRGETFFDLYHFNWAWAIEHKPRRILEIGSRTGISTCQLLSGYLDHSGIERIICCDLFNDGFCTPELIKYNMKETGVPESVIAKVEFLSGDSAKTVAGLPDDYKFDYILVDGDHNVGPARVDLDSAYRLIAPGGVIVFDDIGPDGVDLLPVWNTFKNDHLGEFEWHEDLNGKGLGWAIKN